MTTEQLDDRILELKKEQLALAQGHEQMVAQFQKTSSANQVRYAQLTGAITELNTLKTQLNGTEP